ncbi:thymidine phosphorylase family protein [Candidatus Pacearchaeota archaeon]|nr:thymidine phosphorylase family protein [Candidatus Pacearchaeota archaeon]
MELRIKFLKWSTGMLGAMLHKKTADKIGVQSRDRISIKKAGGKDGEIFTFVNTIDGLIKENEIAISSETKERINLKNGQRVEVRLAESPKSVLYIKKKVDGKKLSEKEIRSIIIDVVDNSLGETEIALFVSGMYEKGMTFRETIGLTKAILDTGFRVELPYKIIADKHCVGGVPGNRTTPIVVSICAAGGLIVPKNSSRAITSAAGTADVIEAIARVDFSPDEIKKIIRKTGACMVHGGGLGMVPADSRIIQVEKILKIDPGAQLLASIMSKKLASGSTHVVIDIPYGKGAKFTEKEALALRKKFNKLAKYFKIKIECLLTDGTQPIGNGIGPIFELLDIIKILDPNQDGPKDLEKKSLLLAGKLFEMTGKANKGEGIALAEKILDSGKAFEKFKEIIKAQSGSLRKIKLAKYNHEVFAKKSGKVFEIINSDLNSIARLAGSPDDKAAGIYLFYHVGDYVKRGQQLFLICSESKPRLNQALEFYKKKKPVKIN